MKQLGADLFGTFAEGADELLRGVERARPDLGGREVGDQFCDACEVVGIVVGRDQNIDAAIAEDTEIGQHRAGAGIGELAS